MSNLSKKVDIHIGTKIRERRVMLGLTQEHISQVLEISYQQLQKYETAANRISSGRLYELSVVLQVPIAFFYDGFEENDTAAPMEHGGRSRTVIELVANYQAIPEARMKYAVAALAKNLADRKRPAKLKTAA